MKILNTISPEKNKLKIQSKSLLYSCDINLGSEANGELQHLFAYGAFRIGPKSGELNARAEFLVQDGGLEFLKGIYEVQNFPKIFRYFKKEDSIYLQDSEDDYHVVAKQTHLLKNPVEPISLFFQIMNCVEKKQDNDFELLIGENFQKIFFKYGEKTSEIWRDHKLVAKISGGPREWNIEYKVFKFKIVIQ